jgi:hypothetical protein
VNTLVLNTVLQHEVRLHSAQHAGDVGGNSADNTDLLEILLGRLRGIAASNSGSSRQCGGRGTQGRRLDSWSGRSTWQRRGGDAANVEKGEVENEERIEEILLSLKEFQRDLADISVLDKINRRLSSISFDQFCAYYDDANNSNSGHSNKLAQYTIETELKRMKFSVLFDGIVYNTEDSIINVFERTHSHDLWKMANQSIYAELLLSLQKQFFRQDLCISFVSTESVFAIDLDMGTLHTQSSFRIMTMSEDAATKKDRSRSTSNSNSRSGSVTPTTPVLASTPRTPRNTLELASISGEIRVDVQRQTLLQRVYNSALQMVFEADLR